MNHSFYSVDRSTHSKVVALALIAATAVAAIGIAAHSSGADGLAQSEPTGVIKLHRPAMMASGIQLAAR
jgi:hypothetical protein